MSAAGSTVDRLEINKRLEFSGSIVFFIRNDVHFVVSRGFTILILFFAGSELVRSYTPVGEGWGATDDVLSALRLAVKKYDSGAMSPLLASLKISDVVTLSGPYGNFELSKVCFGVLYNKIYEPVKIFHLLKHIKCRVNSYAYAPV